MQSAVVNHRSPIPLYQQLREIIRAKIASGEWQPGQLISSESELATLHQVSRVTVRQATQALVQEGLLYTEKGRGTFVAERGIRQNLSRLASFSEVSAELGLNVTSRVLIADVRQPPQSIAAQLHIAPERTVFMLKRVRYTGDTPVAVETSFVPATLCPGIENRDFRLHSFYRTLEEEYGLQLATVTETLKYVAAPTDLAVHLEVAVGSPLFEMEGVVHDAADQPVEAFLVYYRADRMHFHFKAHRRPV